MSENAVWAIVLLLMCGFILIYGVIQIFMRKSYFWFVLGVIFSILTYVSCNAVLEEEYAEQQSVESTQEE